MQENRAKQSKKNATIWQREKGGGDCCVTQIDKKKDAMIQDDSDKRERQESKKKRTKHDSDSRATDKTRKIEQRRKIKTNYWESK